MGRCGRRRCVTRDIATARWGGYKQSGVGRELGRYALDAHLETKQICSNLGA